MHPRKTLFQHPHEIKAQIIRESYVIFGLILACVIAGIFIYYGSQLYKTRDIPAERNTAALLAIDQKKLASVQAQCAQVRALEERTEGEIDAMRSSLTTLEGERDALLKLNAAHSAPTSGHHRRSHHAVKRDDMGTIDLRKAFPPDPKRNEWSQFYEDRGMTDPAR